MGFNSGFKGLMHKVSQVTEFRFVFSRKVLCEFVVSLVASPRQTPARKANCDLWKGGRTEL